MAEINREQYEKDLEKRQEEHLKQVKINIEQQKLPFSFQPLQPAWQPCMHDACSECVGTGIKWDGTACVHYIACSCPKCNPNYIVKM